MKAEYRADAELFLASYQRKKRSVDALKSELNELINRGAQAQSFFDTGIRVQTSGKRDLSDYILKYEKVRECIKAEIRKELDILDSVTAFINAIPDDLEREMLIYRYVNGMSLYDISERMGYEYKYLCKKLKNVLVRLSSEYEGFMTGNVRRKATA